MDLHRFPFGKREHFVPTKIISAASDITRSTSAISDAARASTRTADLASLRRTSGIDDLSRVSSPPSYRSSPVTSPSRTLATENNTILRLNDKLDDLQLRLDRLEVQDAMKGLDEISDPTTRNALKEIADNPASIKQNLSKEAANKLDTEGPKLVDEMKKPAWKNMTPEQKWQTVKDFGNKNARLLGFTAVGVTLMALYLKSKSDSDRINNTEYTIKRITSSEDTVTVTYEPNDKFTKNDIISIVDSNSVPVIDGEVQPIFTGKGVFRFKGKKITTPGDSGSLSVSTSVENHFAQNVSDTTKPFTQAVGQTASTILGDTFNSLLEGLGLSDFFNTYWISSLIVCIIFCISSSFAIVLSYVK